VLTATGRRTLLKGAGAPPLPAPPAIGSPAILLRQGRANKIGAPGCPLTGFSLARSASTPNRREMAAGREIQRVRGGKSWGSRSNLMSEELGHSRTASTQGAAHDRAGRAFFFFAVLLFGRKFLPAFLDDHSCRSAKRTKKVFSPPGGAQLRRRWRVQGRNRYFPCTADIPPTP